MSLHTEIIADSPTAYWPCTEASGNIVDSIGAVSLAATGSPTYSYQGVVGNAVVMPSSGSYFSAAGPTSLKWALGTSITVEFMMRKDQAFPGTVGVIGHRTGSSSNAHFAVVYVSNNICFDVAADRQTTSLNPPTNQWQHFIMRHRGSDGVREIWRNGKLESTVTQIPGADYASVGTMAIGTTPGAPGNATGQISNVAIYNGTYLSDARISAHWKAVANVRSYAMFQAAL